MHKNKKDILSNATKYHTKENKKIDSLDSLWGLIILTALFGFSNPEVEKLRAENTKMKGKLDVIEKIVVGDK